MDARIKIRNAEILCVGTEILIGDIINTNAAYISKRLAELGINQYYQAVTGDNRGRLGDCIDAALERCDLLIMTGGLGPTYDDLTKETVAERFGRDMLPHEPSLERIREFFCRRGVEMTENNEKQGYMPRGAIVFENDVGTAPGLALEDAARGKIAIMLPGPPREMKPMFEHCVMPYLSQFSERMLVSRNVNLVGIGESAAEQLLRPLMEAAENPTVAPYCKEGEVRLRVTASAADRAEGERLCDDMVERIRSSAVGEFVYGTDTTLEAAAVERLAHLDATLACAESCTGGLVAKRITDVPGASDVLLGGVVSYSNEVKRSVLGVSEQTLRDHGAVSAECAREMAEGVRSALGSDYGVSTTGIAGPDGGTAEKPVGLVYIAVATERGTTVRELRLNGDRAHVRHITANNVLSMLIRELGSGEKCKE